MFGSDKEFRTPCFTLFVEKKLIDPEKKHSRAF